MGRLIPRPGYFLALLLAGIVVALIAGLDNPPSAGAQTATHTVTIDGPTSMKRHETVELTAEVDDHTGRYLRYEWRRVLGRNSDTRRWEYELLGRSRTTSKTDKISYTASGIGFHNELRGADRDEVHINVRVWDGTRMVKSDRHEITITDTHPVISSRMQLQPWPSWGGGTVTLITSVCDEDDPVWFDKDTHRCIPPEGPYADARRKPRSYLHNIHEPGPDGGILWAVVDDYDDKEEGRLEPLPHAPWRANYTPPSSAGNGDVFRIAVGVVDTKGAWLEQIVIGVVVQGKKEPAQPSGFGVRLSVDKDRIEVGESVTATAEIQGAPAGPLTYAWRASSQSSGNDAGSFQSTDQPTARWTATGPGAVDISVTVTVPDGFMTNSDVFRVTSKSRVRVIRCRVDLDTPGDLTFTAGSPISPVTLPRGRANCGDATHSLSGLPQGLEFDPDTRVLSGTPTANRSVATQVEYRATDGTRKASRKFTIVVRAAGTTVCGPNWGAGQDDGNGPIDHDSDLYLPDPDEYRVKVGEPMWVILPAAQGGEPPLNYFVRGLPDGMCFDSATRKLFGVPPRTGFLTPEYIVTGPNRTRSETYIPIDVYD